LDRLCDLSGYGETIYKLKLIRRSSPSVKKKNIAPIEGGYQGLILAVWERSPAAARGDIIDF